MTNGTQGRYHVTAVKREDEEHQIDFVVEAAGSKAAWSEARRMLRDGESVQPPEDDVMPVAVEPRAWTVRSVHRIDKPRARARPTEPSAVELIAACEDNGISVAKKVRQMLDAMREARGLASGDEPEGEDAAAAGPGTADTDARAGDTDQQAA